MKRQEPALAAGHVHAEAFARMQYECERCHAVEWVWNSRDGVTPFIITCRACGGAAQHERWAADRYLPDYRPQPGERVFIDLTLERFEAYVLANAATYHGRPLTDEERTELRGQVRRDWARTLESQGEPGPDIAIVGEDGWQTDPPPKPELPSGNRYERRHGEEQDPDQHRLLQRRRARHG